jgi:hypothetical protein
MPALDKDEPKRKEVAAQDDPRRNPDGLYAGTLKRLAISDGKFVDVQNMPKDSRKSGVVPANPKNPRGAVPIHPNSGRRT